MQRHRFYAAPAAFLSGRVVLDADESHHLTRVLRLAEGARVFVFDGEGREFTADVSLAHRHAAELAVVAELDHQTESPLRLTLAQALVKGDKFDLVVQKAVELGVSCVTPLLTEHSDIRISEGKPDERLEQRLARWRRIALEAVKQCGRRRMVTITAPLGFPAFCAATAGDASLLMSEHGGLTLRAAAKKLGRPERVSVLVAAEGGWSAEELRLADTHGLTPVSLGPRILRTETAAITAVALAQHIFGDMA
ncbi:MAG: 16S rRNA (uracil(1498)-N(3))-methyltransferase [Blastocatellia bacterium]